MPSKDQSTSSGHHLGPMPEPRIEPGESNPGGVDAIDPDSGPLAIPDLSPEENPAIEERAPDPLMDEVKEGEDTSTKATRDEDDSEDSEQESPA
jgi:hypothetical protein